MISCTVVGEAADFLIVDHGCVRGVSVGRQEPPGTNTRRVSRRSDKQCVAGCRRPPRVIRGRQDTAERRNQLWAIFDKLTAKYYSLTS